MEVKICRPGFIQQAGRSIVAYVNQVFDLPFDDAVDAIAAGVAEPVDEANWLAEFAKKSPPRAITEEIINEVRKIFKGKKNAPDSKPSAGNKSNGRRRKPRRAKNASAN